MKLTNNTIEDLFYVVVVPNQHLMYDGIDFLKDHIDEHLYGNTNLGSKIWAEYVSNSFDIENHLVRKYGDCKLFVPNKEIINDDNERDRYIIAFRNYCRANVYGIAKKYEVTYALFNPLWNVDGTETTIYDIQDKTTYDSSVNNMYNSDQTETGYRQNTHTDTEVKKVENLNTNTKDSSYQIDSTTSAFLNGYTTTEYGETDAPPTTLTSTESGTIVDRTDSNLTNAHNGNDTTSKSGDDTSKRTGTETHTRSGNIGVTKSSELLRDNIELGNYSFWEDLMEGFIKSRCLLTYEEKEW